MPMHRREVLEEVGGFDPQIPLEDLLIQLKITAAGYTIDALDVVMAKYRQHANNTYKNHRYMIKNILNVGVLIVLIQSTRWADGELAASQLDLRLPGKGRASGDLRWRAPEAGSEGFGRIDGDLAVSGLDARRLDKRERRTRPAAGGQPLVGQRKAPGACVGRCFV